MAVSLLLEDMPFGGRIEKMDSVIASFTSSSFVMNYNVGFKKPPAFDSRIIPINDDDILTYFKWRQDESWMNCINSHGISYLKTKYSNNEANDNKIISNQKEKNVEQINVKMKENKKINMYIIELIKSK